MRMATGCGCWWWRGCSSEAGLQAAGLAEGILQMVVCAIIPLSGRHTGAPGGLMWSSSGATALLWCMQAPVQAGGMGKEQAELWPPTNNAWQCFREQQGSRGKPLESLRRAWCSSRAVVLLWAIGVWGIPMSGQRHGSHWRQFQQPWAASHS